jgi:hypothetical protein
MVRRKKDARAIVIFETNFTACALKLMMRRPTPRHLAGRGESASPVERWLLEKQVRGNNMDDKILECSAPKASVSTNGSTKRRASLTGAYQNMSLPVMASVIEATLQYLIAKRAVQTQILLLSSHSLLFCTAFYVCFMLSAAG